jgi:hypothetical protein
MLKRMIIKCIMKKENMFKIPEGISEVTQKENILLMDITNTIPEGIPEVIQDRIIGDKETTGIGIMITIHIRVSFVINKVT